MRVLLVEDDPTTSKSIELMLTHANLNTYTTDLGEEGIDLAKLYDYDLILLDLELPGKDGRSLLSDLRSDVQLQRIPVVVLTASQEAEENLRIAKLWIEGFLPKPVDIDRFLELVRELNRFWHADMMLPVSE